MIKAGAVLFKEGALLPDSLTFESEPYSVTDLDGDAKDGKTHDTGWTFFFFLLGQRKQDHRIRPETKGNSSQSDQENPGWPEV